MWPAPLLSLMVRRKVHSCPMISLLSSHVAVRFFLFTGEKPGNNLMRRPIWQGRLCGSFGRLHDNPELLRTAGQHASSDSRDEEISEPPS